MKNMLSRYFLFVVIASLFIVLSTNFENVNAAMQPIYRLPSDSYSDPVVCGDVLCSVPTYNMKKELKIVDIYPLSNNFWGILLKVTANKPISDKTIHIISDIDAKTLSVPYVSAHSFDYVYSTIRAFDASSIDVSSDVADNMHMSKQMTPVIDLIDIGSISDQTQTYRVVFDVTATNYPVKNIRINVVSDMDSISYTIADLVEHNTQTNQVLLKSTDAKSVHVDLIGYDLRY